MDVGTRWAALVQQTEPRLPLDEAALLISARANPDLDVAAQLARLDGIAARMVGTGFENLRNLLFDRLGLQGDRSTYDHPHNSYLDRVLDRRRGMPISLSVILIEVGRRCGITLEPVGMPGHFLVRDPERPDELIDCFAGGRRLDRPAWEEIFRSATGGRIAITPDMVQPATKRAVLLRMLANLDRSFERRSDRRSLAWVAELRMAVPDAPVADRIQLAARWALLGAFATAATVLDEAADHSAEAEASRLRAQAVGFRARLN